MKGWDDMDLLDKLAKEDPAIGKAKQLLEEMAADPKFREIYELRRKAMLDRDSDLYEAELRGKMKGKAEGETEKAHNVARAALMKGADVEFVAKITGLPLETIQKIKADLLS